MIEILWLAVAFLAAWIARAIRLPAIVGYLAAGVGLGIAGQVPTPALEALGHAGVMLLLFGVGLHLRLRSVLDRAVLAGGSLHLVLSTALFMGVTLSIGLPLLTAVFLGVALSFSSTVLAATDLENRRELGAYHGRVAIGILLIQDLVAVMLMFAVGSQVHSLWWLLVLPAAIVLRPALHKLVDRVPEDGLILVLAVLLPMGGGLLFEHAGYGAELGAIGIGALLADHKRADQLQKQLWSLKEVLLIGFFVYVGMIALPPGDAPGIIAMAVVVLLAVLPLKALVFFLLLVGFGLRARTAFLAGAALTSYSEFTLMAGLIGLERGLIDATIFGVLATVTAISFALNSPLNQLVNRIYRRYEVVLHSFERTVDHPDKPLRSIGRASHVIVGMGRTGAAAYDALVAAGFRPVGLDSDPVIVERHLNAGRRCVFADAFDPELWDQLTLDDLVGAVIAVPDLQARIQTVRSLRAHCPTAALGSYALRETDHAKLYAAGADDVHHILTDAGIRLAEVVVERHSPDKPSDDEPTTR